MLKVLSNLWLFHDEQAMCYRFVATGEVSIKQLMCIIYKYKKEIKGNELFIGQLNITSLFWKIHDHTEEYENEKKKIAVVPWTEDDYLVLDAQEHTEWPTFPCKRCLVTKKGLEEKGFKKCVE